MKSHFQKFCPLIWFLKHFLGFLKNNFITKKPKTCCPLFCPIEVYLFLHQYITKNQKRKKCFYFMQISLKMDFIQFFEYLTGVGRNKKTLTKLEALMVTRNWIRPLVFTVLYIFVTLFNPPNLPPCAAHTSLDPPLTWTVSVLIKLWSRKALESFFISILTRYSTY